MSKKIPQRNIAQLSITTKTVRKLLTYVPTHNRRGSVMHFGDIDPKLASQCPLTPQA